MVLNEIAQPFETELVSSQDGSTRTEEYLKINPKGRVPALATNGTIITEAPAIMTYLALTHPDSKLLVNTPIGLARTLEWTNWLSGIHASMIAQKWRTERFSNDISAYEHIQSKGIENLVNVFSDINRKLEDSVWAVEQQYSIVDPYLLVFYRWGNRLDIEMKQYSAWTKHALQMEQREAVQTTLNTEGISIWQ